MCLIVFAYQYHPEYNLILAANRDEFYARPTRPMQFWKPQDNTRAAQHQGQNEFYTSRLTSPIQHCQQPNNILAGQDLEQGGTWLGMQQNGRFSAVTNHRDGRNRSNGKRSRGFLSTSFLSSEQPARLYAEQLESDLYDGFNLLIGDNSGLYYLSNRSQGNHKISHGIHGLSNALLNTPWPKLDARKEMLQRHLDQETPDVEHLINLMADNTIYPEHLLPNTGISPEWEQALSSSFIKLENYGTRATTVILQKHNGETEVVEQNYDVSGAGDRYRYQLELPPIGGS
ncbi:NRDE family protein [Amphritea sp. HPY]|uniref:NRDE family protein n=1 Tax=Amphritea sp. HPY TaxID=3421652 RepID=UPI003D7E8A35